MGQQNALDDSPRDKPRFHRTLGRWKRVGRARIALLKLPLVA